MSGSRPPGPALVAAAADADPVTLLVTTWAQCGLAADAARARRHLGRLAWVRGDGASAVNG